MIFYQPYPLTVVIYSGPRSRRYGWMDSMIYYNIDILSHSIFIQNSIQKLLILLVDQGAVAQQVELSTCPSVLEQKHHTVFSGCKTYRDTADTSDFSLYQPCVMQERIPCSKQIDLENSPLYLEEVAKI